MQTTCLYSISLVRHHLVKQPPTVVMDTSEALLCPEGCSLHAAKKHMRTGHETCIAVLTSAALSSVRFKYKVCFAVHACSVGLTCALFGTDAYWPHSF